MQVTRLIHSLFRFARDRAGNAGAEFALTLPLLVVLTFGIVEIGRVLHDLHVVKESVRDGARFLSRMPITCPGGTFNNAGDLNTGIALAMTGTTNPSSPTDNLLGYWDFNNASHKTSPILQISVACIANTGQFQGIYLGDPEVPVVTMQAAIPFTFLFGNLVSSSGTIDLNVEHTVIGTGS